MSTTLDKDPTIDSVDQDGDHDKFAHYVHPPSAITEAMITGKPVEALCGKKWVPTRAPEKFKVCPTCDELYGKLP